MDRLISSVELKPAIVLMTKNGYFLGGLCSVGCGILVPQPEVETVPPAAEAQRPNHWTAREFSYDSS